MSLNLRSAKRALFGRAEHRPCVHCGLPLAFNEATVDHVIPRADGGEHRLENYAVACAECNGTRGDTPYEIFREAMRPVRDLRAAGVSIPGRRDPANFDRLMRATLVARAALRALAGRESQADAYATIWCLAPGFLAPEFVATEAERAAEAAEIEALERAEKERAA